MMKSSLKIASISAIAFILGFSVNNMALSDANSAKIAVVDVQKIVASSSQVKNLKADQQKKVKDLQTFVNNAQKAVAKETNEKKKKALEEKYNKELKSKTTNLDKEYAKKLQDIDKSISGTIAKEAKAKNYNIVLAKGVVLYGGEDITANIMKQVK